MTLSMKYMYPSEKFAAARRGLMAPHPLGEAQSYVGAFHECTLGLRDLTEADLDENARTWVATVRTAMDTAGIEDPAGRGTWILKAESLTESEKHDFSTAVDELASWFNRRFWETP